MRVLPLWKLSSISKFPVEISSYNSDCSVLSASPLSILWARSLLFCAKSRAASFLPTRINTIKATMDADKICSATPTSYCPDSSILKSRVKAGNSLTVEQSAAPLWWISAHSNSLFISGRQKPVLSEARVYPTKSEVCRASAGDALIHRTPSLPCTTGIKNQMRTVLLTALRRKVSAKKFSLFCKQIMLKEVP